MLVVDMLVVCELVVGMLVVTGFGRWLFEHTPIAFLVCRYVAFFSDF